MSAVAEIRDAAGRIPAPKTAFERRIAQATESGQVKRALAELARKQALPLDAKIALSQQLIQDWYESWDGKVSVSFSGGADSSVLLWLVRGMYPQVPAVFCNTGLEYPEVVRLVLQTPNHVILRPRMGFAQVVKNYGWPVASKKIARGVSIIRNPTENNQNVRRLYLEGVNRFGEPVEGFKIAKCWHFLFEAPFPVSDECCNVMKKSPQAAYERATGNRPFVGTMAADSKQRQRAYLRDGCNAYKEGMAGSRSAPLSFWSKQDILQCIRTYNITIPNVYGDIVTVRQETQLALFPSAAQAASPPQFATTGVQNTGCLFCCFGLSQERGLQNRFELLAETHPKLHRYVMDKLGLRAVLEYCRANAQGALAQKFRCGEAAT